MPTVSDRHAAARERRGGRARPVAAGLLGLFLTQLVLPPAAGAEVARRASVIRAPGAIYVTSEPSGRLVWVNGRHAGLTPTLVEWVPAGPAVIEVSGDPASTAWTAPRRVAALVPPGATDTVHVAADPAFETVAPTSRSLPEGGAEAYSLESGRGWRSTVGALLPMAAVALGAAGAWSRQAADRAFDDYRSTADRARMRSRLDRAERLDKVAVGCWIGAEACLVAAAWIWLRGKPDLPVRLSQERESVRVGVELDQILPEPQASRNLGERD